MEESLGPDDGRRGSLLGDLVSDAMDDVDWVALAESALGDWEPDLGAPKTRTWRRYTAPHPITVRP